jgi:hypothetical protein
VSSDFVPLKLVAMSSQSGRDALHEILESFSTSLVSKEAFDSMRYKFLMLVRRLKISEEESAASKLEIQNLKVGAFSLTQSIRDLRAQVIDKSKGVLEREDKIEALVNQFKTAVEELDNKLDQRQVLFEDLQVDVAETVIDTSYLQDEQTELINSVQSLAQRFDSMHEDFHVSKEVAKSENRGLKAELISSRREQRKLKNEVE